jgi:prepilin-type N-terminal cleavage/methylation domain-containing protein
MKTNVPTTRRGFTLVELLVVIVIIASLAGLTAPMVIRQRKKADQTEAISNAKQIGLALFEFDSDYGSYPGTSSFAQLDSTASVVGSASGSSNNFFKMLFQAGLTQSEAMFYCKAKGTKKPDDIANSSTTALAGGEVGFGYATEAAEGYSSSGNPARPLVMTPLLVGGTGATFDAGPFDKNAVLLRGDNSVISLKIKADNTVAQGTGTSAVNPFAPGVDTVWASATAPTINRPAPIAAP